jgi:3-isopropylmalate/(R)-2-methylmalate dehydratase large subunit
VTYHYLNGKAYAPKEGAWDRAVAYWRSLATDAGAVFDREVDIDCRDIAPQVTWGTSPQQVVAIDGRVPDPAAAADAEGRGQLERALAYMQLTPGTRLTDLAIDAAFIGSCTNGRLSDLREAAAILDGRKVAAGVQAVCIPGSTAVKRAAEAEGLDRIFREAGFEWHESGCGLCADLGNQRLAAQRVVTTTNRNFEGRQGPATRSHLASPATVAASAITGRIADPRLYVSA